MATINASQQKYNLIHRIRTNEKVFNGKTEEVEYVVCKECGLKASQLSNHIRAYHKLTPEQYYEKHTCDRTAVMSQSYLDQLTARALTNNPSKDHGGKYSAHSPKFFKYQGLPEAEVAERIAQVKAHAKEKRLEIPSNTTLEYWLERTNGDLAEATKLRSARQRTFSLEKCIREHGEEVGKAKWVARQEKWSKAFTASISKPGISKIGEEFASKLPTGDGIRSALNEEASITIKMPNNAGLLVHRTIRPDYVDFNQQKIIEFHGDYFHATPLKYDALHPMRKAYKGKDMVLAKDVWERDAHKLAGLVKLGYKVHVVWENEYRTNPSKVITECLTFLTN